MGRQINFFQTQKDVEEFCSFFYPKGIVLFDKQGNTIEDYTKINFTDYLCSNGNELTGKNFIAYRTTPFDNSQAKYIDYPSFEDQIIEYSMCKRSEGNDKYFNDGRLYLSNTLYDKKDMVRLYELLRKYIKKNYKYIGWWYFAPHFMKEYQEGKVIACNANHPLDIKNNILL